MYRAGGSIADANLVKFVFASTHGAGFPLRREVRDIPGEVAHRIWNEGLRDYETA